MKLQKSLMNTPRLKMDPSGPRAISVTAKAV
jgi:hypothetical protein